MSETNQKNEAKFDQFFWEEFLEVNGSKFDAEKGQLLYLYSEHFDLEEEKVEIGIFTSDILEIKIEETDEDGEKTVDRNYVPMVDINQFRYMIQL